jgi:hypothetical protein
VLVFGQAQFFSTKTQKRNDTVQERTGCRNPNEKHEHFSQGKKLFKFMIVNYPLAGFEFFVSSKDLILHKELSKMTYNPTLQIWHLKEKFC